MIDETSIINDVINGQQIVQALLRFHQHLIGHLSFVVATLSSSKFRF